MKKRKMRHDFRVTRIIALLLIGLLSVFGILYFANGNLFNSNRDVIVLDNYVNNFSYNYLVNTKDNEFVNYSDDIDYTAYIADLIDTINFDYKYKFEDNSGKKSNITYRYSITGRLLGFYNKDGEEQKILQKDYPILDSKSDTLKGNTFDINESFTVDTKDVSTLVKSFILKENMPISARYDIMMNVEIDGVTTNTLKYNPVVSIEIGTKTIKITGDNNVINKLTSTNTMTREITKKDRYIAIALGSLLAYCVIRLIYLILFTEDLLVIKNKYKGQVNDIIKAYQDRIVMINNLPRTGRMNIVYLDNIEEIAKLSEDLYKPILCYENKTENATQFFLMSDGTVFKFIINKTNKKQKEKKEDE